MSDNPQSAKSGDTVEFTVDVNYGYKFESVTVTDGNGENCDVTVKDADDVSLNKICSFTMPDSDVNVSVVCSAAEYSIDFDRNMVHGSVTVSDNATSAKCNEIVTLTVTPDTGYELETLKYEYYDIADTYYSEEITDYANGVYSFTMPNADVTIKATFVAEKYAININVTPEGAGEVWATINSATVTEAEANSQVGLGYSSGSGYKFVEWRSDDVTVNTPEVDPTDDGPSFTHYFVMPANDVEIEAVFEAIDYNITVAENENGTVTVKETANLGEEVTFTVTPNSGYGIGEVKYSYLENAAEVKTEKTLTPDEDGSYSFEMPAYDVTISVTYTASKYGININVTPEGAGEAWAGDYNSAVTEAEVDSTVELYNQSSIGYKFVKWISDDVEILEANNSDFSGEYFIMPAKDVEIEAVFELEDYNITVAETENGTVTVDKTTANYDEDVTFTVTPNKGYEIDTLAVTDPVGNTIDYQENADGSYSFTMPEVGVTITATFVPVEYNVTATLNVGGYVDVYVNGERASTAYKDDVVSLEAKPSGYTTIPLSLAEWDAVSGIEDEDIKLAEEDIVVDGKTIVSAGNYYFTMPASDVNVKAYFKETDNYLLKSAETENGYVDIDGTEAAADSVVYFDVYPDTGYEVDQIKVMCGETPVEFTPDDEVENRYNFTMPAGTVTITATFKTANYKIETVNDEHGTVTVQETANYKDTVTFTAAPYEGYEIDEVKYSYLVYDAAEATVNTLTPDEEGNYSFEMPAYDVTITVTFKAIEYSVYASENIVNGTVRRDKTKAIIGEDVTFTATPDTSEANYAVKDVKVTYSKNGVEETIIPTKGEDGKYSFTMPAADVYIVVEFATYVFELYEDTEEDMVSLGFADTWEEIAKLIEDGKYMIRVNKDYEFDTKFALPKTAEDINFIGDGKLTFTGTKLAIPVTTVFQTEIAVSNSKNNLIDITVAKDKILILTQRYGEYEEPVQFINKITGTKTSSFASGGASVTVNNIATFGEVYGYITVNGGKATGIAKFDGNLSIKGAKATAAITNVVDGSSIGLFEENGVLPKVTIDNVVGSGDETSTPTITVLVMGETGFAELASGTTVLYSKNDIADNVKFFNKTEDNKPLTAYYYPKTKEIKAEDGSALTLYKGTEASDSTRVGNYPNFERLFAKITELNDSTADYIIEVNAPITLDEKFALPKTANSLTFTEGTAEDADGSLTFTGTKLIIPVNTTFDVKLSASNKTNLIDVSVAKDVTLEITINSYIMDESGPVQFINKLTGTKTSVLKGTVIVNSIATFGEVNASVMLCGGKATGIAKVTAPYFRISGSKATAALTEVKAGTVIMLVQENGVVPEVTVDSVIADGDATTISVLIAVPTEEEGVFENAELSSGTTVLYSKNDIKANVKITNTTSDGEELTAYYYPKTKEIKAENGSALTLYKGVEEEEKELVGSYKNFDELFAEITDSTVDYTIKVNTDITLGTKFAFPKKAKSIVLDGVLEEQEYPALTHTSTKLVIPYDVAFGHLDNVVSNKNNLIDISVAKGATFDCDEGAQFINPDGEVSINKITGTKTSHISGVVIANNISTFDTVEGIIGVYGKATGINKFDGALVVSPEATVDITEIAGDAMIGLESKNGVIPKVTLGEIGEPVEKGITTVSVEIFDPETNEPVELASGTPILYSKKADPDFTDKITIENNGGEMTACAYGKTIKAEYADAVKVQIWNAETKEATDFGDVTYSSFEAAVAAIDAERNSEANYIITLNRDVTVEKFALPKYAKEVLITGADFSTSSEIHTLNVGKVTSITANTDLTLGDISLATTGKSLTINAKKNLVVEYTTGNITAIKGSAKSTLVWVNNDVTPDITGFGTVHVFGSLTTGKVFNVNKLLLDGGKLVISDATTKASVKAIEVSNRGGAIEYAEGAKTALTFTGKDEDFTGELEITGAVANGQTVLISDKVDVTKLSDGITPEFSEIEYEFKRFGKEIRYMGKVLSVRSEVDGEFLTEFEKYSTWDDIVKAIETANNAEVVYTIELLDNYNANGAIKFPKAGTYKQVIVVSENVEEREMYNFNFTGNLTITGGALFDFVNLGAVKNGEPAKYTITGKNYLYIEDCNTGLLTSITGNDVSLIADEGVITADKVKATDVLYLSGDVKAIGGVTAKKLHICGNTNLVMNQGSKFTVTDKVKVYEDDYQLAVTILDKKTGEPASLNEGYVIGSVKGEDAEKIVLNAEAHPNLKIENVKGKLVVKKALNDQ